MGGPRLAHSLGDELLDPQIDQLGFLEVAVGLYAAWPDADRSSEDERVATAPASERQAASTPPLREKSPLLPNRK